MFAASTLFGFFKAAELRSAERQIAQLSGYLSQFALLLKTRRAPTGEIVCLLAQQAAYADFAFAQALCVEAQAGRSIGGALCTAAKYFGKYYQKQIFSLICPLSDSIGVRELEVQLCELEIAVQNLGRLHAAAEERCRTHCALYRRLGLLGGALFAVITV